MRGPFFLLAACLALSMLGGAQSRSLKDSCSDGFKAWLGGVQSCDPRTNPSTCCAPLLNLGAECLGGVYESARSSGDQQTLEASTVLFQACGVTVTPPQSPAPAPAAAAPAPPASVDPTCAAGFQQVATTSCSTAGTVQTCCPALSGLGTPCLGQVVAALAASGDTAALSKLTGVLTSCGIQLPTSPSPSSQQYVDGFNAAAATCKSGAAADCCAALSGLGSDCLAAVLSEFSCRGDTASFTALTSSMQQCSIAGGAPPTGPATPPAPPAGPSGSQCMDAFKAALQSSCIGTGTNCCSAVAAVGAQRLATVGQSMAGDASGLSLFNQIVQACGITLPSAGGAPGATFSFARSLIETPFSLAEGTEPAEAAGALLNTLDFAAAKVLAFAAPKLA
ncbi:hypothetical protein ABPG75_009590 [Micractinium tetrahymenae]